MTDHPLPTGVLRGKLRPFMAGLGLLAFGGIAGTAISRAWQPPIEMAPLHPVAIRTLPGTSNVITIHGKVVETFGNKFVIDDGTARTLVDTGPRSDRPSIVNDGNLVTVQGRFEHGFVHASFLVDPRGTVIALHPRGADPRGRPGSPDGRPDEARLEPHRLIGLDAGSPEGHQACATESSSVQPPAV